MYSAPVRTVKRQAVASRAPRRAAVRGFAALVLALPLVGCGPDGPSPPSPMADPSVAWSQRLREVVSAEGLVDYAALRGDPAALRDFVGWAAEHGPETERWRGTDDNRRLAFSLNALTAVTLWSVLEGVPRDPAAGRPPFARLRFALDGDVVRYDRFVAHQVLARIEEPLAVAALPCAALSCPPVSDRLYEKKDIDDALALRMRRWVASGRLVTDTGAGFTFSPALRPWLAAFARYDAAETPCAAVAPYALQPLRARLEGPCTYAWGPWDGTLDAVANGAHDRER